jgi:hypothetical protein
MTQASLSFALVLKWLVSICVLFAISFSNFVEPYRVWTSVYFKFCTMHSMFMFGYVYACYIVIYPCYVSCPCHAWFLLLVGELPII